MSWNTTHLPSDARARACHGLAAAARLHKRFSGPLVGGLVLFGAGGAPAADLELGEYLSSECTTCHQASGESNGIPGIVGWPATFMVMILDQYKSGERQNPVMRSVAQSLDDDEIAALAAWFEQLDAPE